MDLKPICIKDQLCRVYVQTGLLSLVAEHCAGACAGVIKGSRAFDHVQNALGAGIINPNVFRIRQEMACSLPPPLSLLFYSVEIHVIFIGCGCKLDGFIAGFCCC